MMKLVWITTTKNGCGISDYSKDLWPIISGLCESEGGITHLLSLEIGHRRLIEQIMQIRPDLIHIQHEYGIWGTKTPPFYKFPRFIKKVRNGLSGVKIIATAHNVIPSDYKYPTSGGLLERILRTTCNKIFISRLRKLWGEKTWGVLDGVIIHSRHQINDLKSGRAKKIEIIPHYIYSREQVLIKPKRLTSECDNVTEARSLKSTKFKILLFGFFSRDKGQDLAISALDYLPEDVSLILAGGVRRKQDQAYLEYCKKIAKKTHRVEFCGFVKADQIDEVYSRADLVVAPFRETSGSGSLAQALSRGAAVLASDLELNLELNEREPSMLEYFRVGDAQHMADRILYLKNNSDRLQKMRESSWRYALNNSPDFVARKHFGFYKTILGGPID